MSKPAIWTLHNTTTQPGRKALITTTEESEGDLEAILLDHLLSGDGITATVHRYTDGHVTLDADNGDGTTVTIIALRKRS